ncbi:MAG: hypothetical protein KF767_16280 [Bdellovibrionaceae bacterium]|nr:hypothetical protein [Pseudobdellovibrionaceae bacterium]
MSWKKVGKFKEAHGLKGELWAVIFDKNFEEVEDVDMFGVGPGDEPAQIFEDGDLRPRAKGVIARTPQLTDRNQAEALLGQFLFVPEEAVAYPINEDPEYKSLLGFTLVDGDRPVGLVESFTEIKEQIMVHVRAGEELLDIPFHDDFLNDILDDEKKILMTLPEGLLDINRKSGATSPGEDD